MMERDVFTCLNAASDVVPAIAEITGEKNFQGSIHGVLQNLETADSVGAGVSGSGKQSPVCEKGSVRSSEWKTKSWV